MAREVIQRIDKDSSIIAEQAILEGAMAELRLRSQLADPENKEKREQLINHRDLLELFEKDMMEADMVNAARLGRGEMPVTSAQYDPTIVSGYAYSLREVDGRRPSRDVFNADLESMQEINEKLRVGQALPSEQEGHYRGFIEYAGTVYRLSEVQLQSRFNKLGRSSPSRI